MNALLPPQRQRAGGGGATFEQNDVGAGPDTPRAGRIGPNAITRMAEALAEEVGSAATRRVFAACSLAHYLDAPPAQMVAEADVSALHAAVVRELDLDTVRAVCRSAGLRTADYLLAHRIPRLAQGVLRRLPPGLASRLLLAAIARNAWTFVGSGQFQATGGASPRIAIAGCPICQQLRTATPACAYFAATFERLYRELVHPTAIAYEVECAAMGAAACVFQVRWS